MPNMATLEVIKKAYYIGVWLEDVFTEQVVQNIAAHAKAAKGKKVKVTLSNAGLRFKKSGWFNDKILEFYPLTSIKTVTRNPIFAYCVMFILSDPNKKYRILVLKCTSEGEAIHLVSMYSQIRRDGELSNMELKKRDNGNWTLRERSAHNANRHLAEIFNEKQQQQPSEPANGDVANHVPVLDKSKVNSTEITTKPNYIKRNAHHTNNIIVHHENNNNKPATETTGVIIRDDNGDDYVIETEVTPYPATTSSNSFSQTPSVYVSSQPSPTSPVDSEVTVFRDDLNALSNEVRDIKTILANMNGNDVPDSKPQVLPSKPVVYRHPVAKTTPAPQQPQYVNGSRPVYSEPTVYRAPPKTYEATLVSSRRYNSNQDPWSAHRRLSGNFVFPAQLDRQLRSGTDSGNNSLRVKFETESVKSGGSTRSKSRPRSKDYTTSTTLERSIEATYGRQPPQFFRRHSSSHVIGRPRPLSVHVVGKNELAVYQPYDRYMDVAL